MISDLAIQRIETNKARFLNVLLIGDEAESMINRYLACGELFVLTQNGETASLAVAVDDGCHHVELKNLATLPTKRNQGLASTLVRFLLTHYARPEGFLFLGTGETPSTLRFYQHLGFQFWKREKDYFLHHYDHPIFEENIQLKDRVFLRQKLSHH